MHAIYEDLLQNPDREANLIIIALSEVVGSEILKIGKVTVKSLVELMTRLVKEIN